MDSIEFKPCDKYKELIEKSNIRKQELNLVNNTYSSLLRKNLYQLYGYELHHIVPNYRNKNKSKKERNISENIAILTSEEHIDAHYLLSKFETGRYKYSAMMAFIQLTSLKKENIENIESMNDEKYLEIKKSILESRHKYFSSQFLKEISSKNGKRVGEIRKQRFANDADFRSYILSSLKMSKEKRQEVNNKKILDNKNLPPWKVNKKTRKSERYQYQEWKYFDTIYTGYKKYFLSYKTIAKIIGIDYRRISNIVRIIHEKFPSEPENFIDFKFYNNFKIDFEDTLHLYEKELIYFSKETYIPWDKYTIAKWVKSLKSFYVYYSNIKNSGNVVTHANVNDFMESYITKSVSSYIISICDEIYNSCRNFESIQWYEYWKKYVDIEEI